MKRNGRCAKLRKCEAKKSVEHLMMFRTSSEKLSGFVCIRLVKSVARITRDIQRVERDDESSKEPFVIVINGTENVSSNRTIQFALG